MGHGRAVQAPAGWTSQIAKSGLLGRQELVRPFHVPFSRISNKYIWNPWGIPNHPVQLVLLYLSTLLDSWLAHCGTYLRIMIENGLWKSHVDFYALFNSMKALRKFIFKSITRFSLAQLPELPNGPDQIYKKLSWVNRAQFCLYLGKIEWFQEKNKNLPGLLQRY